ncbi:hypothetical protein SOCE26_070480 [Sorangium cellulosum]|uniref:Secreted protein n=1 Tax=Sorangium cellulosum TaxID=56 RepID=A0A2L0F1W5_SORCE|nr:hypothetical protein [Sorangium cellulosum]AUX45554.1 hypothetical protein SOCE26_070480 [Sorangium cellulosum]
MRPRARRRAFSAASSAALSAALAGCGSDGGPLTGVSSFRVEVVSVNGAPPPPADLPLPANRGDTADVWAFTIEARDPAGRPAPFDGMVRLSVEPGAVLDVASEEEGAAVGRNIRLRGGVASGVVRVTAAYGPTRLWVEDIGYQPAPRGQKPVCANGLNDDAPGDVLIDFPADPGCAFADDDTEEEGSFSAGNSQPVAYALPTVADVQGGGSTTPYAFEGIQINTAAPRRVVVTRVARDGFYVTDLTGEDGGYNHLFAFNFNTPANMRVCDRLEYLAGTVNEFFGFTELSFPSYEIAGFRAGDVCPVPEPRVLDARTIADPVAMERLESGLVRVEGYHISANFGPKPATGNTFGPDRSNCDLNGDGQIDFASPSEGRCANTCSDDPECSEWTSYSARGNYKISNGSSMIQVQTGTVSAFDPTSHRGEVLGAVSGTLRNFSGGSLNWTIEARCPDDLACEAPGCVPAPKPSKEACVRARSLDDNDAETN